MEEIARLIGQYGFPIVMVVWFAWRNEQKQEELTHAINRMNSILMLLYAAQTGKSEDEVARVLGKFAEEKGHQR